MQSPLKKIVIIPTSILAALTITIASLNNSNSSRINLLIWKSPKITLGSWIIISYTSGALLISSLSIILKSNKNRLKRKVIYEKEPKDDYKYEIKDIYENNIHEESSINDEEEIINSRDFPERDINDPPPTIAIPYRIIKKGNLKDDYINKKDVVYTKSEVKKKEIKRDPDNLSNQEDWINYEEEW